MRLFRAPGCLRNNGRMRMSRLFGKTLRQPPSEAETPSHRLLLRAGMVAQIAAGVYCYLPLGWAVLKRIEEIIREEMDREGGQEMLMPSLLPIEVFRPMVLVLLVAVAAYVYRHPAVGEEQRLRWDGRRHHLAAGAGGLGIGFYDGIFGPGTGTFLVFLLVSLLGYSFLQASAKARIVNLATNLGALVVFIPQGAPLWRLGLLMGLANIAGGWLGAHTAIRRGSRFVRVVFLLVVAGLVARLGYEVLDG